MQTMMPLLPILLSLLLSGGFAFVPPCHHVAVPRIARTEFFYKDERTNSPFTSDQLIPQEPGREPVLERAQNYLTGSNLIYFFADLRMLSYTGYAITQFDELDTFNKGGFAEGEAITSFRFLQFILQELHDLVERNLKDEIDEKDWVTNARLLKILDGVLDAILNFDGEIKDVEENSDRERDLNSLVECTRLIRETDTIARLASSLNKKTGKDTKDPKRVYEAADLVTQGRRKVALGAARDSIEAVRDKYDDAVDAVSSAFGRKDDGQTTATSPKATEDEDVDYADVWGVSQKTNLQRAAQEDVPQWIEDQYDGENLIEPLLEGITTSGLDENSVFSNIFRDDIELVYFDDRYQHKKCVYAITVNRTQKKVSVVFRGTTSRADWNHNFQIVQENALNPVHLLPGVVAGEQSEEIGVHRGFYKFLCRQRLDHRSGGPKTRYDFILDIVKRYLPKDDDEWRLCVTGHSLGGALASLFGFYAAVDDEIVGNGQPVEVFTFASPLVGDERFRQAFCGLEKRKRIVHARFCNDGDFATMLPIFAGKWFGPIPKFSGYQHVGCQIQLPPIGSRKSADVFYLEDADKLAQSKRLGSNVLHWMSSIPKALKAFKAHDISEYEKRLVKEIGREKETGKNGLNVDLDQYYDDHILNKNNTYT